MDELSKAVGENIPEEKQRAASAASSAGQGRFQKKIVVSGSQEKKGTKADDRVNDEGWDPRLKLSTDPQSPFFESFRHLRFPILYSSSNRQYKTLLVTSAVPSEGKGFVCANLGIALSQDMEHQALIVDGDLRRPAMARLFGLSSNPGLVEHLRDNVELSRLIQKSGHPKLSILPSGRPPRNPSELLSSGRMVSFINELAERHEDRIILFDSPPGVVASETIFLAKHLDGVILVIRHGTAKRELVRDFVNSIGREKIVGVVYNAYPVTKIGAYLYDEMKYEYYYKYYHNS